MADRTRLTATPIVGRVIEWKKSHGWIEPTCTIEHPDIIKHQGHIFVYGDDVQPRWKPLIAGTLVEFYLYHDGEGLGAEECVARKVLRVTLPLKDAQEAFGEAGDKLPEFESTMNVTIRAYQWVQVDGSPSDLPFLLFEVWGRAQAVVEALARMGTAQKGIVDQSSNESRTIDVTLMLPESRLWKVDVGHLQNICFVEVSEAIMITDPMPCRTLAIKGGEVGFRKAAHCLILQACD